MKPVTIIGIALMIIGVVVPVLQGITFTTGEKVAAAGPVEVTKETQRIISLPPILGVLVLVVSGCWFIVGVRRS